MDAQSPWRSGQQLTAPHPIPASRGSLCYLSGSTKTFYILFHSIFKMLPLSLNGNWLFCPSHLFYTHMILTRSEWLLSYCVPDKTKFWRKFSVCNAMLWVISCLIELDMSDGKETGGRACYEQVLTTDFCQGLATQWEKPYQQHCAARIQTRGCFPANWNTLRHYNALFISNNPC